MVTLSGKSPMKKRIEFFIYYLLHRPLRTAFFAGRMLPPREALMHLPPY